MEDGNAAAAGVPDQTDGAWRSDSELASRKCIEDVSRVAQLGGKGVAAESLGESKIARVVHSAAAEVEGYGCKSRAR
jgi:hypothetical protein